MINRLFNPSITLDFLIGHAFCDYPLLSNAPPPYLGDSLTDVEAAQAAGILPGAVLWPKRADEIDAFTQEALARGATLFEPPTRVVDFCSRRLNPSDPSRDEARSP